MVDQCAELEKVLKDSQVLHKLLSTNVFSGDEAMSLLRATDACFTKRAILFVFGCVWCH